MRPRDWGDSKPGDADDVAPNDPTGNYSELDYELGGPTFTPLRQPLRGPRPLIPDADEEPPAEEPRHSYEATILGWYSGETEFPRKYWVQRQDGAVGIAKSYDDTDDCNYREGDIVCIVAANEEDQYLIVTRPASDELPSIDVSLNSEVGGDEEFKVAFDVTNEKFPVDGTWGNEEAITLEAGNVRINKSMIVDVHFNVSVEHDQATEDAEVGARVRVGVSCIDSSASASVVEDNTNKLLFDQALAFDIKRNLEECTHHITINLPGSLVHSNSVLNVYRDYDEKKPIWTASPVFGGSVTVAKDVSNGWLKIGAGTSHAWISKARTSQKMMFRLPGGPPSSSCDFLVVDAYTEPEGLAGHLVELTWLPPGVTGTIQIPYITGYTQCMTAYGYCDIPEFDYHEYQVKRGLITLGWLLEQTVCNKTGVHFDAADWGYNPCDPNTTSKGVKLRNPYE